MFWAHFASAHIIFCTFAFEHHLLALARVAFFETVFIFDRILDLDDGAIARGGEFRILKPKSRTAAIEISKR